MEHKRLTDRLPKILRGLDQIVAAMHVPLTPRLGMELITLRGRAADLKHLATQLSGRKWVHHAHLVIAGCVGETPATP